MNTSFRLYRYFTCGLILALFASFSIPVIAGVCSMAGQDCHETEMAMATESETSHCDTTASSDSHDETASTCELCECAFNETPFGKKAPPDQAQLIKLAAIVLPFLHTVPEPLPARQEKPHNPHSLFKDSSPIYLMNLVFLN